MSAGAQTRVRRLESDDLVELAHLCREHAEYERSDWQEETGDGPSRSERWRSMGLVDDGRANDSVFCWVAQAPSELAGFASAFSQQSTWDACPYLYLDCLYLRPAYRSQGLGGVLFERVERTARRLGDLDVQWQTPEWNEGAERFYRRLGATAKRKLRFTQVSG